MNRLKKAAILALCAISIAGSASSLQAQAAKPKAVVAEAIKDVGVAAKGEKVSHVFQIRNEGTATLEITEVVAACGCTVVEFDKTIAPGQTGKVNVVIDTETFAGPISKGVTVITNDVDNPHIDLTIRTDVQPYIAAKPGYARYITVQGEEKTGSIGQTIWAPDGSSFEVVKIDSPYPFLSTTFREAKDAERVPDATGKQWRIEMTLSNDAPVGALAEHVRIHTTHPKQKVVPIPISGFVRPAIAVTPPNAELGSIDLKEPMSRVFNIRSFSTEPIKITGIEAGDGIQTNIEPITDGREYLVRLTLNPGLAKGPLNRTVKIKTDSVKRPVIELALSGTVI
jgi:hypothetical protein